MAWPIFFYFRCSTTRSRIPAVNQVNTACLNPPGAQAHPGTGARLRGTLSAPRASNTTGQCLICSAQGPTLSHPHWTSPFSCPSCKSKKDNGYRSCEGRRKEPLHIVVTIIPQRHPVSCDTHAGRGHKETQNTHRQHRTRAATLIALKILESLFAKTRSAFGAPSPGCETVLDRPQTVQSIHFDVPSNRGGHRCHDALSPPFSCPRHPGTGARLRTTLSGLT